ncbi:hypothetical protein K474DRAFT_1679666 [Panus rudis PR-1116 ss-1]|nr:hypothetical protein K474DRAFT_1713256 [Panus rudis PR-1116 ss-1]KAI0071114.1 hypothetical protein K474DRAFT_1679666 [Panus rudis PR-1116 ss-1]
MSANVRGAIPPELSPQTQTIIRWLTALSEVDVKTLDEILAPEFEVQILPASVKKPSMKREAWLESFQQVRKDIIVELKFDVHEIIEGQGSVAVHLTTDGKSATGSSYTHNMIQLFRLKDEGGKIQITSFIEFMDSLYVSGFFAAEAERQKPEATGR